MSHKYDFHIIRDLRKRMQLTIEALAQLSGITYPAMAAIEENKALPSLKTLDAISGALKVSTTDLINLAGKRITHKRKADVVSAQQYSSRNEGLHLCKIAMFDKAKIKRINAKAGDKVHAMDLHDNVYELCYVISGCVELIIGSQAYKLTSDDTMLFDGLNDHSYTQIETGEYITIHVPKDARNIEALLQGNSVPA